jgi:hypothetical protein
MKERHCWAMIVAHGGDVNSHKRSSPESKLGSINVKLGMYTRVDIFVNIRCDILFQVFEFNLDTASRDVISRSAWTRAAQEATHRSSQALCSQPLNAQPSLTYST